MEAEFLRRFQYWHLAKRPTRLLSQTNHRRPTWTCFHDHELFQRFHLCLQRVISVLSLKPSRTRCPQPHHHHLINGRVISVLRGGFSPRGFATSLSEGRRVFPQQSSRINDTRILSAASLLLQIACL